MKRVLLILFVLLVATVGIIAYQLYNNYYKGEITLLDQEDPYLYIPTGSDYETVVGLLQQKVDIGNREAFDQMTEYMKYVKTPMRSGRFKLDANMSLVELIRHLRNGPQAPVNVIINNERLIEEVAGKVARFIEPDSLSILALLQDQNYLDEIGYTKETLMSLFIPNTYELYWNSKPKAFVERMIKEHKSFWNKNNRKNKAEKLGLNPSEVYTLASIIERETLHNKEKPRMAGVYYNRLQKGMLLQADPTAVFARKDFSTPRVTDYHTKFDSPYNTYMYTGLPPGPISMASISSIDGVLNVENHDYVYFCAIGDGSGYHNFARTLSQHNRNAQIYRSNLRKRGLR
ncbi:MAG: endolytic transglycosylase MltG [Bacteroidota bacterium]